MIPKCFCADLLPAVYEFRRNIVSYGTFRRKYDGSKIKRYRYKCCGKTFSDSTFSEIYRQKKPQVNGQIVSCLVGGFSQRRTAFVLKINRKTVIRKFLLQGKRALDLLPQLALLYPKVQSFSFDELETSEHTRCKPLSVVMAVENGTRRILGFRVAKMTCKTKRLAEISLKKYGKRANGRGKARQELFKEILPNIEFGAEIKSDQHPHYPKDVRTFFPNAKFKAYKSRRACVVGQGELKKGGHDPLFSINHTFAMLRANINRLFRRTWCTTKLELRLSYHIAIYCLYHNILLLKPLKKPRI